ncbi:MAG: aspartate aminotransferase family protein [Nanobdellota archaeon]
MIGNSMKISLYDQEIESGNGCYITGSDGKTFLDLLAGAAVNVQGYGNGDLAQAYFQACERIQHTCVPYTMNPFTKKLAGKMIDITPGDFEKRVVFGVSGSDSVDGAIKAARKYTKKRGIISFRNSYHGSTGIAFQVTHWNRLKRGLSSNNEYHYVRFPDENASEEYVAKILADVQEIMTRFDIAGILVEPIQGDAGIRVIHKDFIERLFAMCAKQSVVFIVDEIQSGMGRTGKWWGIEHFDIVPDIIVAGKGLGAGYAPISAFVGRKAIIDSLDKAQHVFTFSGHPPSCAVALKNIEIILNQEQIKANGCKGQYFMKKIRGINTPLITRVRGAGMMIGIETPAENHIASLVGLKCLGKGLYVGYFGSNNEVIRIEPPFTVTKKQIDEAVEILEQSFREVEKGEISFEENVFLSDESKGLGE